MRLEIVKVHLFKKEIKFLLKIRRLLQIKICNNFFIIFNNNIENLGFKLTYI